MRVDHLERQAIRDVAVERFGKDHMVDAFVAVYRRAIAEHVRRSSCRSIDSSSISPG